MNKWVARRWKVNNGQTIPKIRRQNFLKTLNNSVEIACWHFDLKNMICEMQARLLALMRHFCPNNMHCFSFLFPMLDARYAWSASVFMIHKCKSCKWNDYCYFMCGKSVLVIQCKEYRDFFILLSNTIFKLFTIIGLRPNRNLKCLYLLLQTRRNGTEDLWMLFQTCTCMQREIFNKIKWNMIMWWWVALSNAQHHDLSFVDYF